MHQIVVITLDLRDSVHIRLLVVSTTMCFIGLIEIESGQSIGILLLHFVSLIEENMFVVVPQNGDVVARLHPFAVLQQ